jgi:hypothetical protein
METEEYNPKIHCCREWHKDYCECVKSSMKERKKRSRDRNVNGTLIFLKKNKINFTQSKVPNVLIINPNTDNVSLSLKKENGLLKCRYSGSNKWYTFSRQKFIDKFCKNQQNQ